MNRQKRLRLAQIEKRRRDLYIDTLRSEMPDLDQLFEELRRGSAPNFLLIMAAISNLTAFQTDHNRAEPGYDAQRCLVCE